MFRHRSFLFLGSGIRETYLQELFGEVLEIYGPSTRTHFAIMPKGEVDPRFMYERFQIAVVEYTKDKTHGKLPRKLDDLRTAIERPTSVPVSWRWGVITHDDRSVVVRSEPELEAIRGPLPCTHRAGECSP